MLEHTRAKDNSIEVIASLTPGENVSKKGEDIEKGDVAVQAGTRLQPHHLALLAALGITEVDVVLKPKIAILSTGNELVEFGSKPSSSQIVNSNRFLIAGLCHELGADPLYMGIVRDNEQEISSKINEGLEKADIIITTGGTSVGVADLVPLVVDKLGKPGIVVHGIALRPGMPTALGILKGKPIFVLSGYPVAATVGFEVFARPTVLKMLGAKAESRPWVQAKLTRRVAGSLGRRVYLRVKTEWHKAELVAEPMFTKGSGLLSSLTKANGYVIIPENREGLEKGEIVTVHLFSPIYAEEK
jgi:molybdopterin molybdotransferase